MILAFTSAGAHADAGCTDARAFTAFARRLARLWLALPLLCVSAASAADLSTRTLLLDGALAGGAVIAVGERGTILRSTDNAATWTQAESRTPATLTGVSFGTALHGWAVGHDAVILASADGGTTWARQWQGENLSDSFLDVLALDDQHVIAVGAYGFYVSTADGGKTWRRRNILEEDYHLNRITRGPSGALYLAGEHGTLRRSPDRGATWTPIPAPYDGSFYGVLPLDERTLLAHGLRGRLFRSTDEGATWSAINTNEPVLLATAVRLRNGTVALGGQARALLVSNDQGFTFTRRDVGVSTGIAELLELPDGSTLVLGESGANRVAPDRLGGPAHPSSSHP